MDEIDRIAPPLPPLEASAPAEDESDRMVPGRLILNRYKVLAELGRGGMGVVFRCFDETAGVEVVLKALSPELSRDAAEMEAVKANFESAEKLHHPNIAAVRNLERDPATGDFFLVMEYAKGEDLRTWLRRRRQEGSLTFDAVLSVVKQAAAAVDRASSEKIVHRDIRPGDVMIDAEGRVKLLDFGPAARPTRTGAVADQYALGAVTYEMLAGHPPFAAAGPAALQRMVLTREPEEPPNLPSFRWNALRRAMSRDPGDRFPDCASFAAALESPERPMPGTLSRSAVWGVAFLGILAAVALFRVREPREVPAVPHEMQSVPGPAPEFRLKCGSASGRLVFAEGEDISLTVESSLPCYILAYVRQPDGSELVLFPNRYNWNARIPAGVAVTVPGTDKPGFRLVASSPFGTDEIHFVACTAEADVFRKAMALAQRETRHFATARGLRTEAETQAAASGEGDGEAWANAALPVTTKPR